MSDLIEGKHPVLEALKSGYSLIEIMISRDIDQDKLIKDILDLAKHQNVPVHFVDASKINSINDKGSVRKEKRKGRVREGENHQGIVAIAKPYKYCSLNDILHKSQKAFEQLGRSLILICDHLTDVGNLGTIIRSAESVGACGLILPNKRSAEINSSVYRTSAGALAHMDIVQVSNIATCIDGLKDEGFWVVGATEHGDVAIWDVDLKGKIALVLGNEQNGISRLVREKCDFESYLPQVGEISSLNVAQAATAIMYEWLRQNWNQNG